MHRLALFRAFSRQATADVSGLVRRLWHDRRGNYSMIVVLLLPVLTGFVGVGTEMGLWLYDQQSQQTATDAAAFSAATYYKSQSPVPNGNTTAGPNGQAQALAVAASYGFPGTAGCSNQSGVRTCLSPQNCSVNAPGAGSACVQVNNPPVVGTQAGNAAAFEVIIAQSPQQLFSKALISTPVVIKARTVGVVSSQNQQTQTQAQAPCTGTNCVCIKVTNATSLSDAADFTGSAALTLNGCSLEVDDTGGAGLNLSGSAVVSATDIYLASPSLQYSGSGTACDAANQGTTHCNAVTGMLAAPPAGGFSDPYQAQLAGNIPIITTSAMGGCQGATPGIGGSTLGPNPAGGSIYFSQIRIASNTTLRAGTYYICPGGNVTISGSSTLVSTAPFPLATGCTSPYTSCNGVIPFAAGDGVTLVFLGLTGTSGTVTNCSYFSISGGASLQLVPPQTGPFAGIVLTSSINCTPPAIDASGNVAGTATISGGSATQLFGAVDLPDYSITYSGNSSVGTGGCLAIIANSFSVTGVASVANNCSGVGTTGIGPPTTTTTTTTTTVYAAGLAN